MYVCECVCVCVCVYMAVCACGCLVNASRGVAKPT